MGAPHARDWPTSRGWSGHLAQEAGPQQPGGGTRSRARSRHILHEVARSAREDMAPGAAGRSSFPVRRCCLAPRQGRPRGEMPRPSACSDVTPHARTRHLGLRTRHLGPRTPGLEGEVRIARGGGRAASRRDAPASLGRTRHPAGDMAQPRRVMGQPRARVRGASPGIWCYTTQEMVLPHAEGAPTSRAICTGSLAELGEHRTDPGKNQRVVPEGGVTWRGASRARPGAPA
jgi:hypothetical protein